MTGVQTCALPILKESAVFRYLCAVAKVEIAADSAALIPFVSDVVHTYLPETVDCTAAIPFVRQSRSEIFSCDRAMM